MRSRLSALSLALALGACASPPPPPPPAPDLAAEERAIRAQDSVWLAAAAARDANAEAAMFASDGVAYRGGDPLAGPAAYLAYETKYYADNPKSVSTWTTRSIAVASSGDMAVQQGSYTDNGTGPKGNLTSQGNFMTFWKKVDGVWKVAADFSAPNQPAPKP